MKNFTRFIMLLVALSLVCTSILTVSLFADQEIPTMSLEKSTLEYGDNLKLTINLPESHALAVNDWIALFRADVDESCIQDGSGLGIWGYIGTGTQSYGAPSSHTVSLEIDESWCPNGNWPLAPGDYKILLFYNDSYKVEASCPFTVVSGESQGESKPVITFANDKLVSDETLQITIVLPEDHILVNSDWINVYPADVDEDNIVDGSGLGLWGYIGTGTQEYGVPESHTVEIEIDDSWSTSGNWPLDPGEYKVLLFYSDSYNVAASATFTVVEDEPAQPTQAPEATEEPTATEAPVATEEPADDKPAEEKKGCGSVIVSGAMVSVMVVAAAAFVFKKK